MRSGSLFRGMRWARAPRTTNRLSSLFLVLFSILALTRPASAATVHGRVTDPDGRGVPHARIVVSGPLGAVVETVTDLSGDYQTPDLPDGQYDVHVLTDGLSAPAETVWVSGRGRRELPIQLRLSAVQETIVVSASQVDLVRSEAAASVTVVTAADLRARQIETVGDALRDVPGLTVVRSGGRGGLTSLFPRGGSSNYTLVLVDGVRTNTFGGAFDFAHLSTANVERIEIVRGPQSALYGSEAIGAVVHVITKRGGTPRFEAAIEGGNQATSRAMLGTSGARGGWSWGLGAERLASDGFTGRANNGETVGNDDYLRSQAIGTIAYRRDGGADASLSASIGRDERGFPGPWGADPTDVFPGVDRVSRGDNDNRRIGIRASHPWSHSLRQRFDVSYASLSSEFTSPFGPSSSTTHRFDARIQEDLALSHAFVLSGGAEFVRERGRSTYVTGQMGSPIPIDRRSLGVFGEARLTTGPRLNVTTGVRIEYLVRDRVEPDPTAFEPRPPLSRQAIRSLNPKISALYTLSSVENMRETTRVRASAGTGIRPPDVFEIAFTDNADLRPERSRSVELGVEQRLGGGTWIVDAAVFANRYDDLIVAVGRALGMASRYRTDNISNARARGMEVSMQARLPWALRLGAAYTRLTTELLAVDGGGVGAPAPFNVGDPLIRRPRHQGTLDLRYGAQRASAFVSLTARSSTLDLEPNFGSFGGLFRTRGYAVLDAGASFPVRAGLELFGRVGNLTNQRYEETLGFPALGRTGVVGVRVAAGH